ncbi:hypothetical protein ASD65_14210 [Microbacterium sp. Root61]|uniref:2Fe-2S iron-sulfur cluster-binding protein n=1 Tax=Microbacterium sp. Root61 TaxID=1736570 RepID=UPI0006FEF739|nr:2Fe-2S iron-sulfur cluster-binding protein [Microbacterium sp. Root61]KRA25445.1 hypothetical protein ASD65_14210 [Microbacterium sp. Root61]
MTRVEYVHPDGTRTVLDVPDGTSLMRAAVTAGVPGIVGECGGQAMCATCHVYVSDLFRNQLPVVSEDEDEMLDSAAAERTERSRLSCQLRGSAQCDELVVEIPSVQV